MKAGARLYAQKINHGQSEIWLATDEEALTARRTLATNEVVNVTRRHCTPEAFQAFYSEHHSAVGHTATLSAPNLETIVEELRLEPLERVLPGQT